MKRVTKHIPALVSVKWLAEHLGDENLLILNATMAKVGSTGDKLPSVQIPGALFMDIKNEWSLEQAPFPNTMLPARAFEEKARGLGLNKDSVIVVYDEHGIYSSPRAWWMFRSMGHTQVAVLDGGLPAWISAGFETEEKNAKIIGDGDFLARPGAGFFKDHKEILAALSDREFTIIDARAEDRFKGRVEEPRAGLRSGHIPGSENLPYNALLVDGKMRKPGELSDLFEQKIDKSQNLVFSCGSGITACVLALGAEIIGLKQLSVYDGSWTEWGSLKELPVER